MCLAAMPKSLPQVDILTTCMCCVRARVKPATMLPCASDQHVTNYNSPRLTYKHCHGEASDLKHCYSRSTSAPRFLLVPSLGLKFSMKFSSSALFCALVALQDVDALRLGLRGWTRSPATFLRRRDNLSGLDDKSNMRYYTNLTLNGQAISACKDDSTTVVFKRLALLNLLRVCSD